MSITLKANRITPSLQDIQRKLDRLPQEAYKEFLEIGRAHV